jgi:hypothetical protein
MNDDRELTLREVAAMLAVMIGTAIVLGALIILTCRLGALFLPRPETPAPPAGRRVAPGSLWGTVPDAAPPAGDFYTCDHWSFFFCPTPEPMENPRL